MDNTKPEIVKQIAGGYFQDVRGDWWIVNPSLGWTRVAADSRALAFYLGSGVTIQTRAVAGDAYTYGTKKLDTFLTHAVIVTKNGVDAVLCNRVKLSNLLDDTCATDPNAPPTCKTCLAKWLRRRQ